MTVPTSTPPPQTVVERLGGMLNMLVKDLGARVAAGRISMALNIFLCHRLIGLRIRICAIVARIRAGTYVPRRSSGRPRAPATVPRQPPPPGPVRQSFGWLMPLIPARKEEYWHANGVRSVFESLLEDPEMVALIQAAPVTLGRPLRSICWMLRLKPPPILAPPRRRSRPPAPENPATPAPSASPKAPARVPAKAKEPQPAPLPHKPPTPPEAPAWMQNWPAAGRRLRKPA
jgi:hypothetical protein